MNLRVVMLVQHRNRQGQVDRVQTRKSSSLVSSERLVTRTEFSSRLLLSMLSPTAARFRMTDGTKLQAHTICIAVDFIIQQDSQPSGLRQVEIQRGYLPLQQTRHT